MKITIEHKDTKVIIEESGNSTHNAGLQYQNKVIQETIVVICDQVVKLQDSVKKK